MTATRTSSRAAGVYIGRPLGIPVHLSPSLVLLAVLVTANVATDSALLTSEPAVRIGVGAAAAVLLTLSILMHELGHSAVALAFGIPIRRITLFLFGGVAEITREPDSAGKECLVSVAGPLVSLALGLAGWGALQVTSGTPADVLFGYVMAMNLLLGLFNLVPGLPLDGGRVLRAAVWRLRGDRDLATRFAARSGMAVGALLGAAGLYALVSGDGFAVFTLLIALFIFSGARSALVQAAVAGRVPALRARGLARPALEVTADVPLAEALRRATEGDQSLVVVDAYGEPSAVVSRAAVDAVPLERRPWVSVGSVARGVSRGLVLDADLEGRDLLEALRTTPAAEYLVVDDHGVVGVLDSRDVVRELGPRP